MELELTSNLDDAEQICKSIAAGYFYNTAKQSKTGEYKTVKNQTTVYIHPSSVLINDDDPPKWLLYHELAFTTKEYMRMVAPIQGSWLIELAPHYYSGKDIDDKESVKMPKKNAPSKR